MVPLLAPELMVAMVSARGERLHANSEWLRVFGDETLWGRLLTEDRRFAEEYVMEAATGSLVTNQAFLVSRKERDLPVPVLVHFLPVRLPDTYATHRMPVMITGELLQEPASWAQDQTKRRRMEMVGQMAMGIAHDFNNLLTSILGHVELLKEDLPPDSPLAGNVRSAERAALDGAALVRKIQRYIRHEKQERFVPVDLAAIVEEVTALTRPYWHNEPRRLGISIELAAEVEPVQFIRGSEADLREVVVNLVLNAVQAMPTGGTLTLRVFGDDQAVYLEVEDTGVGMPESVQRRIFEPLFTTKGDAGTGMGLTVSYGIVEEHDGQFQVRSATGRGTCFSMRFPPASPDDSTAERARTIAPTLTPTHNAHAGGRLLVVDDEPMVRKVTAKLLRLRGFEVVEASGGREALQAVADSKFDLVITDLGMPEMSGRELAHHLRKSRPALPIVMLTGHTDADDQSSQVDAVVRKPYRIDALEACIADLIAPPPK